jgi:hypothetical protein
VPGNEIADRLAKEGSEFPNYNQNYASITNVKRLDKKRKKEEPEAWWALHQSPGYRQWKLDAVANLPELQLSRTSLHRYM